MLYHDQPVAVPTPTSRPANTSDNEKKIITSSPPTKSTTSAFQTPTLEESPSKAVAVLLDSMSPTKIERIPAIKRLVNISSRAKTASVRRAASSELDLFRMSSEERLMREQRRTNSAKAYSAKLKRKLEKSNVTLNVTKKTCRRKLMIEKSKQEDLKKALARKAALLAREREKFGYVVADLRKKVSS